MTRLGQTLASTSGDVLLGDEGYCGIKPFDWLYEESDTLRVMLSGDSSGAGGYSRRRFPSGAATSDFPELGAEEPTGLVSAVREGIPAGRFDALKELLAVSTEELTDVVGSSPSTLSRRRKRGRFDKDESERIL